MSRLAGWAALLQALVLAFMIAGTHGWIVPVKANTTDYVSFYAAGALADRGQPQAAYDETAMRRAEAAATAPGVNYEAFFNPPPFLLIMQPLALLPYLVSFVLFQALTLPLWLALGTRVAGGGRVVTWCLLAVPSLWWVLGLGQNSFLSASLMAAGVLLLPRRKLAAGVMFGLLCYKPHLGLLIPVALMAAAEWMAVAAAAATVTAIVAATVVLYGIGTWGAFLAMAQQSLGGAIDSGRVLWAARVDPTGAAQELGLPVAAARVVWGLCALAASCCVAAVWRRGGSRAQQGAVLAASVVIAAPFALFYDLIMCSLAACWLIREARQDGFLPGESIVLRLLVLANLLAAPPVVAAAHVPFGAVVGPALLGLTMRRWRHARRCLEKMSADGAPADSFIAQSLIER
jgi:hypothetical protein